MAPDMQIRWHGSKVLMQNRKCIGLWWLKKYMKRVCHFFCH